MEIGKLNGAAVLNAFGYVVAFGAIAGALQGRFGLFALLLAFGIYKGLRK